MPPDARSAGLSLFPTERFVLPTALSNTIEAGAAFTVAVAAIRIERAVGAERQAATDAAKAETGGRDADDTAIAAVLAVLVGIDAPEFATDLATAGEAGAAAAIAGAALAVIRTGALFRDAGRFVLEAHAGIEIEGLASRALVDAGDPALHGAAGASAEALGGIGAGCAAGTAIWSAGGLR